MQIEHKEGYTIIDRRGGEPCRVCACPDECHSENYGEPTMACILWLRSKIEELEKENSELSDGIVSLQMALDLSSLDGPC